MWISAVVAAFLDNVTAMLLMVPVAMQIALTLKINPLTLLIPQVFASNVGGTATLIGAPANVVTVGLVERAGCRISFLGYMQACFFPMLITVAICMVYLLLRY